MNDSSDDYGKWYRTNKYDTITMIEKMKEEDILYKEPAFSERQRFFWNGSLVMVKTSRNVHINNLNEVKEEFLEQFKLNED